LLSAPQKHVMNNVLFLYLEAFGPTGGIQKFNRNFLKALHELSVDGKIDADAWSSYDTINDPKYFPTKRFKGFAGNRIFFFLYCLLFSRNYDTVIVGHLNLGIIGWLLKKMNPQLHIVLIAHGYEVWSPVSGKKGNIFKVVDEIWCVSEFTKAQVQVNYPWINIDQVKVFHNTIDAFFDIPTKFEKPYYLQHRYQLQPNAPLLITVTRLSSTEMYKGYDKVIELMKSLRVQYPNIKYLIAGKSDIQEYNRVQSLIKKHGVEEQVLLIGFVPDDELLEHYLLADLFVMPSKKEGFGIVFIEAMACGLPVVAGNKDGSPEALLNGKIRHLVNPDDIHNIEQGIYEAIDSLTTYQPKQLQQTILSAFGFKGFKRRLQENLKLD